jgi:hypothetical protein
VVRSTIIYTWTIIEGDGKEWDRIVFLQLQKMCPEAKEAWAQLWKVHDGCICTESVSDFGAEEFWCFNVHMDCAFGAVKEYV